MPIVNKKIQRIAFICADLRRLDPSRGEYAKRIHSRIYELAQSRIPPIVLVVR